MRAFRQLCAVLKSAVISVAIASGAQAGRNQSATIGRPATIRVVRDGYGVPHIYAASRRSLYYGLGYAIAQDRLFQLEMMRRSVWGEVAEVLGADYVAFDRETRIRGYSRRDVEARLAALPAKQRALFKAYAAGINAWIDVATARGALPARFGSLGFAPRRWSAADLAQIFIGNVAVRFTDKTQEIENASLLAKLTTELGPLRAKAVFDDISPLAEDPQAVLSIPAGDWTGQGLNQVARQERARVQMLSPSTSDVADGIAKADRMLASRLAGLAINDHSGSNVWLVGKSKSANGHAMLMGGPQMGFTVPGFLYEVGLHGGGMNVVGSTPIGFLPIFFGHSATTAWSSTIGRGDAVDTFVERLDPGDPTRYLYRSRWLAMARRQEIIEVRDAADVAVTCYRTVHGPVLAVDPSRHLAYSRARAWEGRELQSEMAWLDSTLARDFGAFRQAAFRSAFSINWWYADTHGNIGLVYPGRFPIRAPGQDPRLPSPGTGEADWVGFIAPEKHPYRLNPSSGYFANWNQQPARGWFFADTGWSSVERAKLLQDFMASHAKVNADDMLALNKLASTTSQTAGYFIPGLVAAVGRLPNAPPELLRATRLIAAWDHRRTDADGDGRYDSPALAIYDAWLSEILARMFNSETSGSAAALLRYQRTDTYDIGRGPKLLARVLAGDKASLPVHGDYLRGRSADAVQVEALQAVIERLSRERGVDMAQWRDPVLTTEFTVANAHMVPQGASESIRVPLAERGTQNHLVELRPGGAVGRNIVAPGQSEIAGVHATDQIPLFTGFRYKSMLLTPEEVEKARVSVTILRDPFPRLER